LIPRPFTRVAFAYGEPIWVPRDADEALLEALRKRVEEALQEATRRAEAALEDEDLWRA
jgi:lysophospholipid acyltransferase (LPLAT)-like uncharacterized protein